MKTILQVRKKGYNNDYRYTEFFLHNALQPYGFHLTRDEKTADFSVTAYIDRNSEHFWLVSEFFDQLKGEEKQRFCEVAAVAMKSEVLLCPLPEDVFPPNASVYEFLYSSTSNAYEEPALIEKGDSVLQLEGHWWEDGQRGNTGCKIVNYGGSTVGLDVILQVPFWAIPFLSIESAQIRRRTSQGVERQQIAFERMGNRFICQLESFRILPGRNRLSARWCRARSKYQNAEFYIDLTLKNKGPIPVKLFMTVSPFLGEGFTMAFDL